MNKFKLRIKTFINKSLNKVEYFFNKRGYTFFLVRKELIELTIEQVLESKFYLDDAFQKKQADIYIKLPIKKARTLSGENFFDIEKHHSVVALNHVLNKGGKINIEKELLEYYKKIIIPKNKKIESLSEVFGIEIEKLKNIPPWLIFYPWANDDFNKLNEIIKQRDLSTYVENKKRGVGVNASEGGSQYIFTSEKRAELEAKLIANLYNSISQKGFDEKENLKDPIGAILLVDGEKYAWMINAGIHRVCVLSALKKEKISVLIKGVYYKKDIKYWPNVQNSLYSEKEAEELFNCLINC